MFFILGGFGTAVEIAISLVAGVGLRARGQRWNELVREVVITQPAESGQVPRIQLSALVAQLFVDPGFRAELKGRKRE